MTEIGISASDGGRLVRIADALAAAAQHIPVALQEEVDEEAQVHADLARGLLQEMPTHSGKSNKLRERIAAGVKVTDTSKPDAPGAIVNVAVDNINEAPIPRGIESIRGWRHPVFGNRDVWVQQRPRYQWFSVTMEQVEASLTSRFSATLDDAAEGIARA